MWHSHLTCFYVVGILHNLIYGQGELDFVNLMHQLQLTSHIWDSKWTWCKDEFTSTSGLTKSVWSWNWGKGAVWCWTMKDPWNIFWHYTN